MTKIETSDFPGKDDMDAKIDILNVLVKLDTFSYLEYGMYQVQISMKHSLQIAYHPDNIATKIDVNVAMDPGIVHVDTWVEKNEE